ncbi:hypothetical protein NLM33_18820 [Bradyrhizobium sp. CCGUVB1N3]|uniref:hypothetical protein n=1 Tax=Bradyrhizobium sp. CCGUVB1N3 TaxID=2949629 RepID=UPI0020B2BAC2|nr:hypothetical protein [Bradyrhizobium sp. CCGUVB1N3]MCP3471432.1 hypothetical protein [Bradyrhizobium sp. CCGUVB1N3]MCP3472372.1 hypothetical protein [Bradyrhizobium sp. CCGUVB1N3]
MNKEKRRAYLRRWEAAHREERNKPRGNYKERARRYRQRHPEKRCEAEARRRRDPVERAADAIGRKMRHIISGSFPSDITALGYDGDVLRRHIAAQFLPGMSWANYGEWHADHIRHVPLA